MDALVMGGNKMAAVEMDELEMMMVAIFVITVVKVEEVVEMAVTEVIKVEEFLAEEMERGVRKVEEKEEKEEGREEAQEAVADYYNHECTLLSIHSAPDRQRLLELVFVNTTRNDNILNNCMFGLDLYSSQKPLAKPLVTDEEPFPVVHGAEPSAQPLAQPLAQPREHGSELLMCGAEVLVQGAEPQPQPYGTKLVA
eukprot:gene7318-8712_t